MSGSDQGKLKLPFLKFPVCLEGPTSVQLVCARPLMVFVAQGFGH